MRGSLSVSVTDDARGCSEVAWYAFRVCVHQEKSVSARLLGADIATYLPRYTVRSRWSDRVRTSERCLFPGYIFCNSERAGLAHITEFQGVVHALPNNLAPLPIAPTDMEIIYALEACGLPMLPAAAWQAGDRVTIQAGPLAGISGVITRGRATRFVVSIETFHGHPIAVTLDAESLQSAK